MGWNLMHDVITSLKDVKTLGNGQKLDAYALLLLIFLAHENNDQYDGKDGWWGTEEQLAAWLKVCKRTVGAAKRVLQNNKILEFTTRGPAINHGTKDKEDHNNVYKVDYEKIRQMNPAPESARRAEGVRTKCAVGRHDVPRGCAGNAHNTRDNKESNTNNNTVDDVVRTLQMLIAHELNVDKRKINLSSIRKKVVGKDIREVFKIVRDTAQSRRNNPQKVAMDPNDQIGLMFEACADLPPVSDPEAADPAQWAKLSAEPAAEPAAEPQHNPVDDLWNRLVKSYSLDEKVSTAIKGEFYELFEALSERRRQALFERLMAESKAFPRDNLAKAFREAFEKIRKIANLE